MTSKPGWHGDGICMMGHLLVTEHFKCNLNQVAYSLNLNLLQGKLALCPICCNKQKDRCCEDDNDNEKHAWQQSEAGTR